MTLYVVCALGGRCFWAEFNDCFLLWLRDYEVHRWIVLNPSFGSLTTEACALLCGTSFAAAARAIRSHARGRTWRRKSKWYAIILRAYWNTWETTRSFENDEWILDDSILQIGGLLDQEFWVLPPWKLTCPLKNSKEFSEDYCPCEMAPFFFFSVFGGVQHRYKPLIPNSCDKSQPGSHTERWRKEHKAMPSSRQVSQWWSPSLLIPAGNLGEAQTSKTHSSINSIQSIYLNDSDVTWRYLKLKG